MAGTSQTCIVPGTSGRITGDTIPGVMEVQGQVLSLDFPAGDGLGGQLLQDRVGNERRKGSCQPFLCPSNPSNLSRGRSGVRGTVGFP